MRREESVLTHGLHRKGGDHAALRLKLRLDAAGRRHWLRPGDTIAFLRQWVCLISDRQLAHLRNRSRQSTGPANGWTEQRVRSLRNHHEIAVHPDSEWAERW